MRIRFAIVLLAGLCLAACSSSTPAPAAPTPTPTPAPTPTPTPTPTPGSTASVSMVNGAFNLSTTAFQPSPLNVAVGTVVTFTNNDITTHDAKADNGRF